MAPLLVDVGNCNLHKVHNAFAKGLDAFGVDVEEVVRNIYCPASRQRVDTQSLHNKLVGAFSEKQLHAKVLL